jgi:hypothetical protein
MRDEIKATLQAIITAMGQDIFTRPQQFRGVLADIQIKHDGDAIKNLLRIAICELQAYTRLQAGFAQNNLFIVDNIASEMATKYMIQQNITQIVIESIAELHGYVPPERDETYTGEWLDGKYHGYGTKRYDDDAVYEGEWKNGQKHGKGTYTGPDGDVYEGDFANDKANGKGKYTWPSGHVYIGDFVNGHRHGKGIFTWIEGDVYEGDFDDDEATGKGIIRFSDGDIYIGEFVGCLQHGIGKYTHANGEVKEGKWHLGEFISDEDL